MKERRSSQRVILDHELPLAPPHSLAVRVLDVSVDGVLLQTTRTIERGTRGRLRLNIGGSSFAADIQVQRVMAQPQAGAYHVGATFVGIRAQHRQVIERFTRQD